MMGCEKTVKSGGQAQAKPTIYGRMFGGMIDGVVGDGPRIAAMLSRDPLFFVEEILYP